MFGLLEKRCFVCKRKTKPLYKYYDKKGKSIKVCSDCAIYAERRAFRKKV